MIYPDWLLVGIDGGFHEVSFVESLNIELEDDSINLLIDEGSIEFQVIDDTINLEVC